MQGLSSGYTAPRVVSVPVYLIVENPKRWPLRLPGAEIIAAREYITEGRLSEERRSRVYNLCRTAGYQSVGYYVSLLATARGHKPLPSVHTIYELRQSSILRVVSEDLDDLLQRSLAPLKSQEFVLSVYFGRNVAVRYDRLCQALFEHFPVPLLRAEFVHVDRWRLQNLRLLAFSEIPESHQEFVIERAQRFFGRPHVSERKPARYRMAILVDPDEVDAPSDARALRRFIRAGRKFDIAASFVRRRDLGRIAEYDALFIRATTRVDHYTYESAAHAEAQGLVVVDDTESIVRCGNKVYQAELFERHGIACPRTMIVHKDNVDRVGATLGFPCVLKRPDSAFSAGVVKAENEEDLQRYLAAFFADSELVVAQEFTPSQFDWRIGILDGKPLYACKYHMAPGHWQVQRAHGPKRRSYGKVETLAVADAPPKAVKLALRAAKFIGQGFYGVDVKQRNGKFLVMEVNDNPNIDAGAEDKVLKDDLYLAVMRVFRERLDRAGSKARAI